MPGSNLSSRRSKRPYRVVVAGSNYGQAYLEALSGSGERFRPVALLARGSERSRSLARRYGLPLCRSVGELPEVIDLACAALPASADDVVLALLERGIHVLGEHPRAPSFLERAWEAAGATGVCFQINGHFGDLPAAQAFARRYREESQRSAPRFVEVVAQERSLYGALDVLAHALESLRPRSLDRIHRDGVFTTLAASLGSAPALFRIHAPDDSLDDGSPRYLVDLRLSVGFDRGVLTLLSVAGPVVWNANLAQGAAAGGALWQTVEATTSTASELRAARATANHRALEGLVREIEGDPPFAAALRRHTLEVAGLWRDLGSLLRPPAPL